MIIFNDIFTGDEMMSDTYKINEVCDGVLWEVDCKKYPKGKANFVLEGSNPSAEDANDDVGDDAGTGEMVHDIEESFQLTALPPEAKPSKEAFKADLKSYIKRVNKALAEKGASEETIKQFQGGAGAAMKKLVANYDNYDFLMGSSMDPKGMYILIDFREDGVTPYATLWKHGLVGQKV